MVGEPFYKDVAPELSQGDILDGIPHLFLRPPLFALRKVILAGGREALGFYEYPPPTEESPGASRGKQLPGGGFHFQAGEQAAALCQVSRAIVLSHDCDIENEKEHRLVALVRPLAPVTDPGHQEIIRQNRNFNYLYLPAAEGLDEAYVDFRRLTSLSPHFLATASRLRSLSGEGVRALQFGFFRFLTHHELTA